MILLFTREMVLLLFIFWEFLDSFISTPIGYKDTNLDMKDFSKLSKYCLFNCFNIGSLIGFVRWNAEIALVPTILRLTKGRAHLFRHETIVENYFFYGVFYNVSYRYWCIFTDRWNMQHFSAHTSYTRWLWKNNPDIWEFSSHTIHKNWVIFWWKRATDILSYADKNCVKNNS